MYELIQAGEHTYYIDCPTKIGIYVEGENRAVLIDGGSDKDAAKKVLKILDSQGWTLSCVFNTHSHADHIGGNTLLQQRTGCRIYAPAGEIAFVRQPVLEPALLFGASPIKALQNKFLMAAPSQAEPLDEKEMHGMKALPLPGHSPDMTAFCTPDGVWFLGDSLVGETTLEKHGVFYLYDAEQYFESLNKIEQLEGSCWIPSHAPAQKEIGALVQKNREKLQEILNTIENICGEGKNTEEILQSVFLHFGMNMDIGQHALVGASVKACLGYLEKMQKAEIVFQEQMMKWRMSGDKPDER